MPPAERPPRALPAALGALALLVVVPAAELAAGATQRAALVEVDDWRRAAARVRPALRPGDAVAAAPGWADPMLRRVLGDAMPPVVVGRSDLAPFERLWVLSIRGADAPDAPAAAPALDERVGPVRVRRWDLGPSPVRADLVARLDGAQVTLGDRPCPRRTDARLPPGGLGAGPMPPRDRFVCDPGRPWLWVGETVTEDLDLAPRRCVWQHPAGEEPVRVALPDVPLGDRLVLYAGLYYEHERMRTGGPVHVRLLLDGRPLAALVHRDGDGWKRLEAATPGRDGTRGRLTVEVTAPDPHLRSLCWAGSTRAGPRRGATR